MIKISKEMKKRLRNYYLWTTVSTTFLILAPHLGLKIVATEWDNVFESILGVLIMLGIIQKPLLSTHDEQQDDSIDVDIPQ